MPVDEAGYPIVLLLRGRRCLVVGGGPIAARKAAGLVAAGASVHVIATEVGEEVRRQVELTWEERPYATGDVDGFQLVMTATGDLQVDGQVFAEADQAGVWVNSADDPARCSFILPAVVRRGPLSVSVSSGGRSPALVAWLRDRLGAELGPEYETLLDLLSEERDALRSTGQSTEGRDWQGALDSGMLDDVRAGRLDDARERLRVHVSPPDGPR